MKTITVTLDEYEVANLRELLRLCGMPYSPGYPVPYNTGDWLGQIFFKLEPMETDMRPNMSLAQFLDLQGIAPVTRTPNTGT